MQNPFTIAPPGFAARGRRIALAGLAAGLLAAFMLNPSNGAPGHQATARTLHPFAPNLTPTDTPTPSPTPTYVSQGLAGGTGDQQAPHYDGNIVVWEDNSKGDWDIQARDLSNGVVFPVYVGPGDQQGVAISDTLVVWQDSRNGNWDIYGTSVTGDTGGKPFSVISGAGDQRNPAVSGNMVVWEDAISATSAVDIVAEDITLFQPRRISAAGSTNANPAISGNIVVWQTKAAGQPYWQIVALDLTGTSGIRPITQTGLDHTNPAINGNTIVWQENTAGNWDIMGYDLNLGTTFPVTQAAGDQTNPSIEGDTIAYVGDELLPAGAPTVCGASGKRVHQNKRPGQDDVLSSVAECQAGNPAAQGGRIVWDDQSPIGGKDIYAKLCSRSYNDVLATDYFAVPVRGLSCVGAINGYADGSFRPYANTTRGQMAKIIVRSLGLTLNTAGGPHFSDVPPSDTFYAEIETAYNRGMIGGFADGTYRSSTNVTRGQLSKIVVLAKAWAINTTGGPHFSDVPVGSTFYNYIETAVNHGIITGFGDGTFHPNDPATRGQISKIVWLSLQNP
jgi:beta propeller repeat protein